MAVFDHAGLDHTNEKNIESLKFTETEIMRLRSERDRINGLLKILENNLLNIEDKIISCPIKIVKSSSDLFIEFSKNGFESKVVQEAVSTLRLLFFDDDLPAFKDLACVDIDQCHSTHCFGVGFVFESISNPDNSFSIFIPSEVEINPEMEDIFEIDCYMYLKVKSGKGINAVFLEKCHTMSYLEMKKAIDSTVESFNAEKKN